MVFCSFQAGKIGSNVTERIETIDNAEPHFLSFGFELVPYFQRKEICGYFSVIFFRAILGIGKMLAQGFFRNPMLLLEVFDRDFAYPKVSSDYIIVASA